MKTTRIVSLSFFVTMFVYTVASPTLAWSSWTNTSDLLGATYVYSLLEASDGYIYAGTGEDGDVFRTNDGGATWTNTSDLHGAIRVKSLVEASDGYIYAGTGEYGDVFRTNDGGATWTKTSDLGEGWSEFHHMSVNALLEASDGYVYAGRTDQYYEGNAGEVFRTNDGGATWLETSDLLGGSEVNALLEASDGYIYAGTYRPYVEVLRTNDGGATWLETSEFRDFGIYGRANALMEASDGYIWAASDEGNYHTNDGGATWTYTGRPVHGINALLEATDGYIYQCGYYFNDVPYAIGGAVYRTNDRGITWSSTGRLGGITTEKTGSVYSLLEASDGQIYAGTRSFGNVFKYSPGSEYSAIANAQAATYGSNSLIGSGMFNELALILVPIGAVIFLRIRSRKR